MKKLPLIFFTLLIAIGIFAPQTIILNKSTGTVAVQNTIALAQGGFEQAVASTNTTGQDYDIGANLGGSGLKCKGSFWSAVLDADGGEALYSVGCQVGVFLVYNIFYNSTQFLASITAGFADNFLWQSLQSWTYQNDFILSGWTAMRDLANISFIAGLLYAAFLLLSGNDGGGKKIVTMVIMLALGINFSLFFTRLMIDGGNILARSIYQNIEVANISDSNKFEKDIGSKKQISAGLVQIMNPQRLLQDEESTGGATQAELAEKDISVMIFLFILAGIVNIMMIFMFIKIGLSFLGRTVGLMILMIMAPLTVFSELLPVKDKLPMSYLSLSGWFKEVWQLVVMAPIYVFFIYLMILFFGRASEQFKIADADGTGDWIARLISVGMPIFMTYFMMKAATDMTKKYSGEIGGAVASAVGAVGGAVVGGAMMLTGAGAGKLIGGSLGGFLERKGATGVANLAERRLYQGALKKDQKDRTDEENAAVKKIETIKNKNAGTRTAEEQKELNKVGEGNKLSKVGNFFSGASASTLMSTAGILRKKNFDPRAFNMLGFNMNEQLGVAGLGNYKGYGGFDSKSQYISSKGSYEEMVNAAAKRDEDRIKARLEMYDKADKILKEEQKKKLEALEKDERKSGAKITAEGNLDSLENGNKTVKDDDKYVYDTDLKAYRKATNDEIIAGVGVIDFKDVKDRISDLEKKKEEAEKGVGSFASKNAKERAEAKNKIEEEINAANELEKIKVSKKDLKTEVDIVKNQEKSLSKISEEIKKQEEKIKKEEEKIKKEEQEIQNLDTKILATQTALLQAKAAADIAFAEAEAKAKAAGGFVSEAEEDKIRELEKDIEKQKNNLETQRKTKEDAINYSKTTGKSDAKYKIDPADGQLKLASPGDLNTFSLKDLQYKIDPADGQLKFANPGDPNTSTIKEIKEGANLKIDTTNGNYVLDASGTGQKLSDAEKEIKAEVERKEAVLKSREERIAKQKKSLEDGTFYESDLFVKHQEIIKKKEAEIEKARRAGDNSKANTLEAELVNIKANQENLVSGLSDNERDMYNYAKEYKNHKTIMDTHAKRSKAVRDNIIKEEIDNITNAGANIGAKIIKGLLFGVVAGVAGSFAAPLVGATALAGGLAGAAGITAINATIADSITGGLGVGVTSGRNLGGIGPTLLGDSDFFGTGEHSFRSEYARAVRDKFRSTN